MLTVTTTKQMDANDLRKNVWQGAIEVLEHLSDDEVNQVLDYLAEVYPNGMDMGALNDFIWNEKDEVARILGYEDFDKIIDREDERDLDEIADSYL